MTIDTRQSLINSAELMLRSRGYAAFSYADLEKIVGIKSQYSSLFSQKKI